MMTISPLHWKKLLKENNNVVTAAFISKHILGNLIGYRSTSLHRADDADALYNLIIAIKEMK